MGNWLAKRFAAGPVVPVLRFSGVIGQVGIGRKGLTLDDMNDAIERAFKTKKKAAVAISVNSPGGSPVQSALIAARIRALAEEQDIPVYAFCEDVAASGGYWLACAADHIYAEAASIVGSIGVISAGFGFTELIAKAGVERRVHTAGESKAMLDPFRPEDPKDIERLTAIQEDVHDQFKAWVRTRRGARLGERRRAVRRHVLDRPEGCRTGADRRGRQPARHSAREVRREGQAAPDQGGAGLAAEAVRRQSGRRNRLERAGHHRRTGGLEPFRAVIRLTAHTPGA